MTVIRCPPSEHEYTIKYQDKTYYGELKKIQNAVKNVGISSPIMHYPYICEEEGCGIRFMFHADITEHYMLHHNITNPKIDFKKLFFHSHRYTIEERQKEGFFTIDELMTFTEDDFKQHSVFFNGKKTKSTSANDSSCPPKKKKTAPSIEKIEHLLNDFASVDDVSSEIDKSDVLRELEHNEYIESDEKSYNKEDTVTEDEKVVNEESIEATMVIDLTKAPEEGESDDGIEIISDFNTNKNDNKTNFNDYSRPSTSSPGSSCYMKLQQNEQQILSSCIDKMTPERPPKPRSTPTKGLRNSPILHAKSSSIEKNKPSTYSLGSRGIDNIRKNYSPMNKSNIQHSHHISRSRDHSLKDDRDVFEKVTQILNENAPKGLNKPIRNNNVDGINNTPNYNTTIRNQNIKQPNVLPRINQKTNYQDQHSSTTRVNNAPSPTITTTMVRSNGMARRSDRIYYCMFSEDCNFFTRYRINYEKHMSEHAIISYLFKCNSCPLVFQTENVFIEHKTKYCIKSVGPVKPLHHFNIPRRQEFINLANYYDLIMCYYSEVCSFVCNTIEELKYHIQQLHGHDQLLYICMKCNAYFKDKVALAIHSRNYCWKTMEQQMHEGKLMMCNAECCDFSSYSVPEWHIHMASHLYIGNKTPYECGRCFAFLATKTAQVEHEKYFCPLIKPKLVDLATKHHHNTNV